jgi:RHS repeat-associated protein
MVVGQIDGSGRYKRIMTDRLGSTNPTLPYGGNLTALSAQYEKEFATYPKGPGNWSYADQRYYDPAWGRFTTPDPQSSFRVSPPGSLNLYAYVRNDPINRSDPRGLCDVTIAGITQANINAEDVAAYGALGITVFPYAGNGGGIAGEFQGFLEVAIQAFTTNDSTFAAVKGLVVAASQGGPINVTTFSGGAAAFTAAVGFLNASGGSNVTSMIQNITYVSPGNVGSLYTNENTIALWGAGVIDSGATFFTALSGIPIFQAANCGHSFGCLVRHFALMLIDREGPPCDHPSISEQEDRSSFWRLLQPIFSDDWFSSDDGGFGHPPTVQPMTAVTSTIRYDLDLDPL